MLKVKPTRNFKSWYLVIPSQIAQMYEIEGLAFEIEAQKDPNNRLTLTYREIPTKRKRIPKVNLWEVKR